MYFLSMCALEIAANDETQDGLSAACWWNTRRPVGWWQRRRWPTAEPESYRAL